MAAKEILVKFNVLLKKVYFQPVTQFFELLEYSTTKLFGPGDSPIRGEELFCSLHNDWLATYLLIVDDVIVTIEY